MTFDPSPYQFIERSLPFASAAETSRPVIAVAADEVKDGRIDARARRWADATGFAGKTGDLTLFPDAGGGLGGALFGLGNGPQASPFLAGMLARQLPAGNWHIESQWLKPDAAALGFGLGSYRFERYRKAGAGGPRLTLPAEIDRADLMRQLAGVFLARDLVNMPANAMGPAALEVVAGDLARHYGAALSVICGDDLIDHHFPMIHAVGRAGADAPRLIELRWGRSGAPKLTLVGKGVCFDTGGLNLKPAASMLLMKKDMGGAANILGLALMLMDAGLDIDLRVLIPAVENAIAGDAFRPGDILTSRKGLTVQIDNTDAEGRLVLADALAYAEEDGPELIIDMATLTGAARVALGADMPPFYSDDEPLAEAISAAGATCGDPLWRLPLYDGYDGELEATVADLTNAPSGGFAGSITAALFLKRFVARTAWVHFDIYAWSPKDRPQGPKGGEAQGIRALYRVLGARFA